MKTPQFADQRALELWRFLVKDEKTLDDIAANANALQQVLLFHVVSNLIHHPELMPKLYIIITGAAPTRDGNPLVATMQLHFHELAVGVDLAPMETQH